MARYKDREKAIVLRIKGYSYSQISSELDVSKSTLSGWLRDMPLSQKRLDQLQRNDQVIEKIRETKRQKKIERHRQVYRVVSRDIATSTDPNFVAGFYLYWGEGTKTAEYTISLTNSDPAMIVCFVQWLDTIGVQKHQLRCKLHLYADQDERKLVNFWCDTIGVSRSQFYKTYRKASRSDRKTYKGMFSYGTCVVSYGNRDTAEYILQGIAYLRDTYNAAS